MKTSLVILACGLILAACAGLGAWGAGRLRRRSELLAGAGAGVESLMRDIDHLALPLAAALAQAAGPGGAAAPLFNAAAEHLRSGQGLTGSEAWLAALADMDCRGCREALTAVGAGLGETESHRQLQQLAACRQRLAQAENQAEQEYARWAKIWRASGWCGGAVIILLLL